MFKIVETVERGRKELTIVPQRWEQEGKLYWPKKFASKLQQDPESMPETNWIKMSCKVKRSFLPSYDFAEQELDKMVNVEDTEQDEELATNVQRKRVRVLYPRETQDCKALTRDFNSLASSCINENSDVPLAATGLLNNENCEQEQTIFNVEYPEQTIELTPMNSQILSTEVIDNSKLDAILTTLNTVVENQHKIMRELATFQTVFEVAMKKKTYENTSTSSQVRAVISPLEPMDSLEDITKFNEKLKNDEIFKEYLENLVFICGKNTRTKGIDHSYMLVDKFFSRKFFTLCSWAGGTKGPNAKFPFKYYENVINLFFKLVNTADQNFTLEDCEEFFKNVIRNSARRNTCLNMRTSKSKNRPKKLAYQPEAQNNEIECEPSKNSKADCETSVMPQNDDDHSKDI